MKSLLRRLKFLWNRRRLEADLDEEIRDHLERKAAHLGDADAARRQFGNISSVKEESRPMWTGNFIEQLAQDVRYALRAMSANRLFTAVTILSLALGIGANTAIYSFMDAVMLRALPVSKPEELVILNWRAPRTARVVRSQWGGNYDEPGGGTTSPNYPYPAFKLLRGQTQVFSSLFGHANAGRPSVVFDGRADLAVAQYVTGDLFSGLGVGAALGRLIGRDDDRAGAPPVVVLTFDYWRSRFGASPAVLGKAIQVNGGLFTIAGVAAPGFSGVSPSVNPSLFIPLACLGLVQTSPVIDLEDKNFYWLEVMGRLKPGVTLAAAQAQLAGPFHNFVESYGHRGERALRHPCALAASGPLRCRWLAARV